MFREEHWRKYIGRVWETTAGKMMAAVTLLTCVVPFWILPFPDLPAWIILALLWSAILASWWAHFSMWRAEWQTVAAERSMLEAKLDVAPLLLGQLETSASRRASLPELSGIFTIERQIGSHGAASENEQPAHIVLHCQATNIGAKSCIISTAMIYVSHVNKPEMSWVRTFDSINARPPDSKGHEVSPDGLVMCTFHTAIPGYSFADLSQSAIAVCIKDSVGRKHWGFARK